MEQSTFHYGEGASLNDLEIKYGRAPLSQALEPKQPEATVLTNEEQIIKSAFQITDDEVALFKQNGITDYSEMGQAKHFAAKDKITLQQVLDAKKGRNSWTEVDQALGGARQ